MTIIWLGHLNRTSAVAVANLIGCLAAAVPDGSGACDRVRGDGEGGLETWPWSRPATRGCTDCAPDRQTELVQLIKRMAEVDPRSRPAPADECFRTNCERKFEFFPDVAAMRVRSELSKVIEG